MTAAIADVLAALQDRGIAITGEGDRLRLDAPAGAVTPDLCRALAEHKQALLARLENGRLGSGDFSRSGLHRTTEVVTTRVSIRRGAEPGMENCLGTSLSPRR